MTRIHCRDCAFVEKFDEPDPHRGWCHYYPAKATPGIAWPAVDLDEDWCSFGRASHTTPAFLALADNCPGCGIEMRYGAIHACTSSKEETE